MGRLDVRVVEARNLPNPQSVGEIDPYVKITLEHNTHKTSVIENKTSPTWNEVFKFTVADENSAQLQIEVWNSNVASDDFLGCYNLSLTGLTMGEVKDEWYLLSQCKGNAEIHLRLLPVDFGARPQEPAPIVAPPVPQEPAPPLQPAPVVPMQQQPPPPQQQPAAGYGAPSYGSQPQQASGVYGAPAVAPVGGVGGAYGAPAPQGGGQPQWGSQQPQWGPPSKPVPGQVVQPNQQPQKKGGGLFGSLGKLASGAVDVVGKGIDTTHRVVSETLGGSTPASCGQGPGGASKVLKNALWVNTADGFVFAVIDGSLRHIPDGTVYANLFGGSMSDHAGMNTFSTAPGSPAVPFPFGKPVPSFAHLVSCNGEFYLIDDNNGQQVRRNLLQGKFHQYSFMAGQNLRPMSLQELQNIPQGPPL